MYHYDITNVIYDEDEYSDASTETSSNKSRVAFYGVQKCSMCMLEFRKSKKNHDDGDDDDDNDSRKQKGNRGNYPAMKTLTPV